MPRDVASKRGGGKPWRGRGGNRGGRRNRDLLADSGQSNGTGFTGFSMADEARNTSYHTSHGESVNSLRKMPVSFISAGSIEPLKELEDDVDQSQNANDRNHVQRRSPSSMVPQPINEESQNNTQLTAICRSNDRQDGADNSRIVGPEDLEQDILRGTRTEEDQAEEEPEPHFFFDLKGSCPTTATPKRMPAIRSGSLEPESGSSDEVILFRGRDATPARRTHETVAAATSNTQNTTITLTQMETEIRAVEDNLSIPEEGPRGRRRPKNKGKRALKGQKARSSSEWNDDEEHSAAVAADYLANLRENGELSDILGSQPADARNTRDLGGSDNEGAYDYEPKDSTSGTMLSTQAKEDAANQHYETGSELDDATLARILQDQIPSGGDEIALDGFASSSSDTSEHDDRPAYGQDLGLEDFDFMDWSRPSLQKKKKGKAARGQMTFDVSDEDLQEALEMAWKNDRLKKSERKKRREELRALGMLGKNASNPDDLRVKYPTGMNIEQVGDEIRVFLMKNAETLTMPPMDTHARKIVHEIANKFNIKSKSTGKASQRRTSLYRTKRTLQFSDRIFNQTMARINRKFLPRLDIHGKRGLKAPLQRSKAAASYQEGEVVGAAAPELGSENRGHAMLEKMGWSNGTALGALDNKGILQPVPQMMKKTKAGLG